jgi:tetratricopeptide (TPR) repeat protein
MSQPVSGEARNAFLRGRYLWNQRTPASIAKSIDYYTDAIRADRNYADAYAALSVSYVTLTSYGNVNPADLLWKAQFAAERALALNANLSAAHTALAGVKNDRDWDWRGAEEEYRRAIAINPSDSTAHHWYGLLLTRQRRGKEALAQLQRALALDPLSLIIATDVAETYYYLRQPDEAMTRIDDVLALNPNFGQAHLVKASILEQQGNFESAAMETELAARLFGNGLWIEAERAYLLALQGKNEQALEIARKLEDTSTLQYVSGAHIAQVYCALHDPDAAMQWLDRGYDRHDIVLDMLAIDPHLDSCRTDLRFQALLRRLKLPT